MSSKEIKIHIRRCHICNTVNEQQDSLVEKCNSCGKALAPFMFFDEKSALGLSPVNAQDQHEEKMQLKTANWGDSLSSKYPPIYGLAVYW